MRVDLSGLPSAGDALLILPPFAGIERPSYGLHLLQALARREGFAVSVLYANIHFAREIGERLYSEICYGETGGLHGEKVFAAAAFGAACRKPAERRFGEEVEEKAEAWLDAFAAAVARLDYPIIGCNLMFEQTAAAIGLFRRLRKLCPERTLLAGGSLCEGEMARGILSLSDTIDYVFSGESEQTFVEFLRRYRSGTLDRRERVVQGTPCFDLESLPNVDYDEYFAQIRTVFPDSQILDDDSVWLSYEGSRGCWWGQKHHCTFCGINGTGMAYRQKSAGKVHRDLCELAQRYPSRRVMMLDNIMPHAYFKDLVPLLAREKTGLEIFYEQKANLTFRKVRALSEAGINLIQPGIESLSDNTLRLMKKGVRASQNIALLRFARAVEMSVNWNVLYAFPGDDESDYEESIRLIPFITHLNPPSGLCHLSLDRFSPYHADPERYGIRAIWPAQCYFDVYPEEADFARLAYHFEGDYDTAARRRPDLVRELDTLIEDWRAVWQDGEKATPMLGMRALSDDIFLIVDTRAIATRQFHLVDRAKAMAALLETRSGAPETEWAVENHLAVPIGDVIVPLVVADRTLFGTIFDPAADERQSELHVPVPLRETA